MRTGPTGLPEPPAPETPAVFTSELGNSGPRVVLLHGLFGQGRNWLTVARALSDEFRVTMVDLPNHGRSAWTAEFSYALLADSLAEFLADTLAAATEPLGVVGHSLGGKVAMALALRHPALVARLVVVDVAPARSERLGSFGRYVAGMRALDLDTLRDRSAADAALVAAVPDPVIRGFLLQNLRREGSGWRWQMNLALLGDRLADVADWPADIADTTGTADGSGADLVRFPGPVLWIAGAESDYIRPEDGPAMRALFPRVQLVTVKRSGHWVHADQPEVFVTTIRRFLHPA